MRKYETGKKCKTNRVVIQTDYTGNILNEFYSILDASKHLKLSSPYINNILNGRNKQKPEYKLEYKKILQLNIENEIWKPVNVSGYERYTISNMGRIRSTKGLILKISTHQDYNSVSLSHSVTRKKKSFTVHKLVALTFIDNPNKLSILNHIDENKRNNKTSNLEWVTQSENVRHSLKVSY